MINHGERWMKLCEQAAKEQDPEKLMELTAEIIRLLDEKGDRATTRERTDPTLIKAPAADPSAAAGTTEGMASYPGRLRATGGYV